MGEQAQRPGCQRTAAHRCLPNLSACCLPPLPRLQAEASPEELQRGQQFLEACKERVVAEGVPAGRVSGDALVAPAGDSASICELQQMGGVSVSVRTVGSP